MNARGRRRRVLEWLLKLTMVGSTARMTFFALVIAVFTLVYARALRLRSREA